MTVENAEITRFVKQVGLVERRVARLRSEAGRPEPSSSLGGALLELEALSEELQVASEELRVQQQQLEEFVDRSGHDDLRAQLLDFLPVNLLVTDPAGIVRQATTAACRLVGRSRTAVEGLPLTAVVVTPDRPAVRAATSKLGRAVGEVEVTATVARDDGGTAVLRFVGRRGVEGRDAVLRWVLEPVADAPGAVPHEDGAGSDRWLEFHRALADLTSVVLSRESVEEVLAHVSRLAERVIHGADAVSVTLLERGRRVSFGLSSPAAGEIDRLQYDGGEGPCLDALSTGDRFVTGGLADDPRWPGFAARAADRDLVSILAEPLIGEQAVVGALNVYSSRPDAFDEQDRDMARAFARSAAVVVQDAAAMAHHRRLVRELAEAMTSRAVIDQARGIIMAQTGCSEEDALERLKKASQRENVKLRDLANRLVKNTQVNARGVRTR